MAARSGGDPARIEGLSAEQSGYATPKVDVRAAVLREDGALLMVRETSDSRWSLRGGWRPFHIYKLFFRCEIVGGAPRISLETTEIGFFREEHLPAELSIGRVVPFQIGRVFAHYRDPGLPTEFD